MTCLKYAMAPLGCGVIAGVWALEVMSVTKMGAKMESLSSGIEFVGQRFQWADGTSSVDLRGCSVQACEARRAISKEDGQRWSAL